VRPQPLSEAGAQSNRAIGLVFAVLAVIITAGAWAGLSIRDALAMIPRLH
jgi:hypothetical protein